MISAAMAGDLRKSTTYIPHIPIPQPSRIPHTRVMNKGNTRSVSVPRELRELMEARYAEERVNWSAVARAAFRAVIDGPPPLAAEIGMRLSVASSGSTAHAEAAFLLKSLKTFRNAIAIEKKR